MAEAVAPPVLAGGIIGVGQAAHEDDAHLLTQRLNRDGDAGRRAAGHHDSAVLFDHALCGCARRVGLRLRIAGDEFDLFAENAVSLQGVGLQRLEHAAAFVDVLDGKLIGAQLVGALIGVGAGLRHVESERHALAGRRFGIVPNRHIVRPGIADKMHRPDACQAEYAGAGGGCD